MIEKSVHDRVIEELGSTIGRGPQALSRAESIVWILAPSFARELHVLDPPRRDKFASGDLSCALSRMCFAKGRKVFMRTKLLPLGLMNRSGNPPVAGRFADKVFGRSEMQI
jgi:hypothetical protein